jgi:flagellar biosynthesis protein FlhA
LKKGRLSQIAFPIAVVLIVVMMIVPLPTVLIDLFVTVNIATAVLVLLMSMNIRRALEFSSFPSLLLVLTLARLGLNVSTTRSILSTGEAGGVIHTFGSVVVAGNLVVGIVVFLILTIVQFIVVAQGAGRVAEVSARFTLDAMPGKQMAIDADLAAGLLDEEQARKRRKDVSDESDFYGAMDGASKFVKGDAIAGIIIVLVNLIGGLLIGVLQGGMSITDAVNQYSLLSIGDGLVSQLPALLLSVASGLIVTRAAGETDLGGDVFGQFRAQHKTLTMSGGVVVAVGLIPGMPKLPFLLAGGVLIAVGRRLAQKADAAEVVEASHETHPPSPQEVLNQGQNLALDARVEALEVDLSFDLVELADTSVGGDLLERVGALRRKIAMELGFVIPAIRTRDDANLPPYTYVIRVHDVEVSRGELPPGRVLVITDDYTGLPGEDVVEPVFRLPARWVPVEFRAQAESLGATVVDRSALIITHLSEVVRRRAGKLLSRSDVKLLVDGVRATDPTVVDELIAGGVTMGEVQKVLGGLLDEGVPIRDLVRILEVVSERARTNRSTEALIESVRTELGESISSNHARDGILRAVAFDAQSEGMLAERLRLGEHGSFIELDPQSAELLSGRIAQAIGGGAIEGANPVILCAGPLRSSLQRVLRGVVPGVPVLSYSEIAEQLQVEIVANVSLLTEVA